MFYDTSTLKLMPHIVTMTDRKMIYILHQLFGHRIFYVVPGIHLFHKKHFKDVSREFDDFQVNTHVCKLRCWYS